MRAALLPFCEFVQDIQSQSVLRAAIASAYRRPETECLPVLIEQSHGKGTPRVRDLARRLVQALRGNRKGAGIEGLIQEFSLSSQEGVALMCLAEALLRIPDRATRDVLIRDKISHGNWRSHMGKSPFLFVNAAAWGLMLTGKLVGVNSEQSLSMALTRMAGKGGEPLIRKGVDIAMRMLGEQFVAGQTISDALANSREYELRGFCYSYDMLGEAAMTAADALEYYDSYELAIHAIGKAAQGSGIYQGPGISIKLSALHPRYSRAQRGRVMAELLPRVRDLAKLARKYDIGVNIDAEEADRLDISLDLLEALCFDQDLSGWNGIGFVVQAYQKRAPFVIDYVIDLARRSRRRLMLRLVKGAYWDAEIKRAQIDGLEGYPVYTRKIYTDISYLACARKLLTAPEAVYPQFATHNAYTVAAIYYMAGEGYYPGQYEFQCLHGMGEPLYDEVVGARDQGKLNRPCRIYAPVGTHETLLAYLVRRLLENGSNTSFVNQVGDEKISIDALIGDPVQAALRIQPLGCAHDKIPLPRDLYAQAGGRLNSAGLDLNNELCQGLLSVALLDSTAVLWRSAPFVGGREFEWDEARAQPVRNPADQRDIIGYVIEASDAEVDLALQEALHAAPAWQATPPSERAQCLMHAAQLLEDEMQSLLGLLVREAGKTLAAAVSEVREAVDYLRYYAGQIERTFSNDTHHPLGVVLCISPWNFPLAIFIGQIAAALATGNTVLAKPAEQTSLIAAAGAAILRRAGVPAGAVQLLPGLGETVGARLVSSPVVGGVLFTGSIDVARWIAATLAQRLGDGGRPIPFIAETGGQNAMIVDSSALAEQVVLDVLTSAFDSAGQRCSALRVLCVQKDCADHVLSVLRGALHELRVGNPGSLATDMGPVIDGQARAGIQAHIHAMRESGHEVDQSGLDASCEHGLFVAPALIAIKDISVLKKEIFGPVLHVVRYHRDELDTLIDAINATGYGLTFGVHSRIDETITRLTERIRAGNIYVNRNMVGAVVGVQPFGGQGLSGTGPKAGGPFYLLALLARRPGGLPVWCTGRSNMSQESADGRGAGMQPAPALSLPGPTGENNIYYLKPRGMVLCVAASRPGAAAQYAACAATSNLIAFTDGEPARLFLADCTAEQKKSIKIVPATYTEQGDYQAVLFEGDRDVLRKIHQIVARRDGPIVSVHSLSSSDIAAGSQYFYESLLREVSVSINTAAAGGNASLMMVG